MNPMNSKLFILFSGKQNSGKDEAAKYLASKYSFVKHLKLAYPIQDMTAALLGKYQPDLSHRELFEDREFKEILPALEFPALIDIPASSVTVRRLMQGIGEEFGNQFISPLIWSTLLLQEAEKVSEPVIVVSDARKPDQITHIRDQAKDVYVVYLKSDTDVNDPHASESWHDWLEDIADVKIFNKKDIQFLHELDLYVSIFINRNL